MNKALTACILLPLLLNSCADLHKGRPHDQSNHAFISYRPAPPGDKRVRVAVKDLIDLKDEITTAGSEYISKHSRPAVHDAEGIRGLRRDDVVIVGKANLTELAVSVAGINEYYGTPENPLDRFRKIIPGGSSSGCAVAVASGMADIAIGTDTAGSIRVPAACCGIYGLKTTFGLISMEGVVPISPEYLDTMGPLAKDIPHLAKGMDLLTPGFEARYQQVVASKPEGQNVRIGRLYLDGTSPAIDEAIDAALRAKGFQIIKLSDEFKKEWETADKHGRVVAASSAWLSAKRYEDKVGVTARTKATIFLGEIEHKTNYAKALAARPHWQSVLRETFKTVDLIALPTMQMLPPSFPMVGGTPLFEAYIFGKQNTVGVNYAGNPALAVPVHVRRKRLPASLQLVGPPLGEAQLLNAGRILATNRG